MKRYGTVIVLEDDLVTNRYFLRFMNDALSRYEKNPKVTGVTGFPGPCGYGHCRVVLFSHADSGTSWCMGDLGRPLAAF